MSITAVFGKALGNNKGSIQNFGIVGITVASEQVAKFVFFYCPCDYPKNKLYGSTFIWGPSFLLLLAGYLANRRTWRLMTGLLNRTQGVGKGGKRIIHFIFIFLQIGMKAIIAPATWFLLAMLKGDYYACAQWPNPEKNLIETRKNFQIEVSNETLPKPCQFNSNPAIFKYSNEADIIARNLRAQSHVIGWCYVSIGLLIGVISMCVMRCKSRFSYEQSNYIERYRSSEISAFEEKLSEKAEEQAKGVVDRFFSKPRNKEDWDQIAVINDKVNKSKRGRPIYSPLHNFVNKESRRNAEEADLPDLVGSSAVKKKELAKIKKTAASSSDGGKLGAALAIGAGAMLVKDAATSRMRAPIVLNNLPSDVSSKPTTNDQTKKVEEDEVIEDQKVENVEDGAVKETSLNEEDLVEEQDKEEVIEEPEEVENDSAPLLD